MPKTKNVGRIVSRQSFVVQKMHMNLYEVIFYTSYGKTDGDEDTIYLVRAPDFMAAVEFVRHNASRCNHGGEKGPVADVVHEIGVDASPYAEADGDRILRGPYCQCAYNFGWRSWQRKIIDGERSGEWEEKPYIVN
jgi:hypothetical protein